MWRAALLLLLSTALPARADTVFVLNSGDASISVLDAVTRTETRRIPVLREVHHLVVTPDGRELVVGDSGGNELFFLDPQSGEIRRRERISNPYHLEYSPNGRYLVIASLRRDQIDIYDAATLTLLQRFRRPDKPSHVAFSPDSRFVYVTLQGTGQVAAVDMATRATIWIQGCWAGAGRYYLAQWPPADRADGAHGFRLARSADAGGAHRLPGRPRGA
jgi:YVTN family beta-propeller protein